MNVSRQRILSFWFNRPPIEWIISPPGMDEQIETEFSDLVTKATRNELDDWTVNAEGSVALVVLLDQFPRNLFRGTKEAFGTDGKAYDIATKAIARGFDKQLGVIQASAFYMPLLHQENLIASIAARGLFKDLEASCATDEGRQWVSMGVSASEGHMKQLERFGRYPTRNAVLRRENTADEEEFLKEHSTGS